MDTKLGIIYSQIPKATCPEGCGKCCGIVYPSRLELNNIYSWCVLHKIEPKDFTMAPELDCPYLGQDKRCTIYPVRPFLCRILGASHDLPCPLGLCSARQRLNSAVSRHLYSQVYLHGKEKARTERHRSVLLPLIREVLK